MVVDIETEGLYFHPRMKRKIKIVVTIGDPCGIGPQVTGKALRRLRTVRDAEFLVVGDADVLASAGRFKPGQPTLASAKASLAYLTQAVRLIKEGKANSLVTGPICKESVQKAGFTWPGHTEFLADAFGVKQVEMVFVSEHLKVVPVTRHMSLRQAIRQLDKKKIVACGRLMFHFLKHYFHIPSPKIAVCGLNPHAGEGGLFGNEEKRYIAPAVMQLNRLTGAHFFGPLPADNVFRRAVQGEFDLVMALTHDQGLIPFKMTAFDTGVNLTAGLPFIRTSPVHGTAFDIAKYGCASEDSMFSAILLAYRLTKNSRQCY